MAVVGAFMATPAPAVAQAPMHLSPAGWAGLDAMSDPEFWDPSPDVRKPWAVERCDVLPPAAGDRQVIALRRTCIASMRWLGATFEALDPALDGRRQRAALASSIRQGRILTTELGGIGDQVTGDCHRFFAASARSYRSLNVATTRYLRDSRAGRRHGPAYERWAGRFVAAALPLLSSDVSAQSASCRPPAAHDQGQQSAPASAVN